MPLFLTLRVITEFVTLDLAIPSFKFRYYSLEYTYFKLCNSEHMLCLCGMMGLKYVAMPKAL